MFLSWKGDHPMKIRKVAANPRRKVVEVSMSRGTFVYPFARLKPRPSPSDPIRKICVDRELGSEAVITTRIPIISVTACCTR